jgi:hypothetical protein
MSAHQEKRQFSRTEVNWPVILLTPQRILGGEAKNIGLGGRRINKKTDPLEDESFRIFIKPPTSKRFLLLSAEVAWKRQHENAEGLPSSGVGVQFTKIAGSDRQFLSSLT